MCSLLEPVIQVRVSMTATCQCEEVNVQFPDLPAGSNHENGELTVESFPSRFVRCDCPEEHSIKHAVSILDFQVIVTMVN
jgi:hypothetical protein